MARQEFKVIIIDADPEEAEKQLNELGKARWEVVGVAHEDRVILSREYFGR